MKLKHQGPRPAYPPPKSCSEFCICDPLTLCGLQAHRAGTHPVFFSLLGLRPQSPSLPSSSTPPHPPLPTPATWARPDRQGFLLRASAPLLTPPSRSVPLKQRLPQSSPYPHTCPDGPPGSLLDSTVCELPAHRCRRGLSSNPAPFWAAVCPGGIAHPSS